MIKLSTEKCQRRQLQCTYPFPFKIKFLHLKSVRIPEELFKSLLSVVKSLILAQSLEFQPKGQLFREANYHFLVDCTNIDVTLEVSRLLFFVEAQFYRVTCFNYLMALLAYF